MTKAATPVTIARTSILSAFSILCLILLLPTLTYASAYQVFEQNVAHQGVAHANDTAGSPDASMGYYNPAALVGLAHPEFILGVDGIQTEVQFKGCSDISTITPFPFEQCGKANGGVKQLLPFVHIAFPYRNVLLSFNITTPFGLGSEFSKDAITQYIATETNLKTLNLGSSIAWQVNRMLQFGIGVDRQYLEANFNNLTGALQPGFLDSEDTNHLESWVWGWHAGVLLTPDDRTRVGLSFRSRVTHHATGKSELKGALASIDLIPHSRFTSNDLSTRFILPKSVRLGLQHQLSPQWTVMGDAAFTAWGDINDLVSHNVAGLDPVDQNLPPAIIQVRVHQHLRDTWRVATGVEFKPQNPWRLRAGVACDQTPTRNATRNLQMPGSDRMVGSLGVGYVSTHWALDAALAHYWLAPANISVGQVAGPEITHTHGRVRSGATILGIQLSYRVGA